MKTDKLYFIFMLIFCIFLLGCNYNEQIPPEFIGKKITSPIVCNKYLEFLNDSVIQFSCTTCDSGGVFGGGNFTGDKLIKGKYKLKSKQVIIIDLSDEITITCNNGSQTKYSKELILSIPEKSDFMMNSWEANFVLEGISSYVLPVGKKWREWQDIQFVYRFSNNCVSPNY